jgi:hypothetical protein
MEELRAQLITVRDSQVGLAFCSMGFAGLW